MDTSTTRVMMMASSRTRYRLAMMTPPTRPQAAAQPCFLSVDSSLGSADGPTPPSCTPKLDYLECHDVDGNGQIRASMASTPQQCGCLATASAGTTCSQPHVNGSAEPAVVATSASAAAVRWELAARAWPLSLVTTRETMGRPSGLASSSSDASLDIIGDSMTMGLAYLRDARKCWAVECNSCSGGCMQVRVHV